MVGSYSLGMTWHEDPETGSRPYFAAVAAVGVSSAKASAVSCIVSGFVEVAMLCLFYSCF